MHIIPFVPISQLEDAMNVLRRLGRALSTDRETNFAISMVQYLDATWMNGPYSKSSWNVFEHRGDRTNNHAEGTIITLKKVLSVRKINFTKIVFLGYNFRLNSKKDIG